MRGDGALDPGRAIAELRELRKLTGDERGAQRVAWTVTWARARDWLQDKLAALPVEVEVDEAGNLWARLAGATPRAVLLGGHLDSVPDGGWLDGALDVVAGLEVLRRVAAEGEPPVGVVLVDWADEEGARFGRSLLGSGLAAGSIDPADVEGLTDRDGTALPDALAEHGVDLRRANGGGRRLADAAAYLELHIEQGPLLERAGLPLAVVTGTAGVQRHAVRIAGQAVQGGGFPMDLRHDALVAAARLVLEVRAAAPDAQSRGTVGDVRGQPGIPTAVPGLCELVVDQRHADARGLRLFSGALHDAAEVARAGVPTAMLFVQSTGGLSHHRDEDTPPEALEVAVRALDRLAGKAIARAAAR